MGHQKELLSGFSRCFERIFLLLFSFDNPFSHFVGVNGVVGISLPDSFGVVPTPGTHKGPTAPPCHPVPLPIGKPPRHQATARRAWERECTTCSGTGWGWGWMGPCGCQASRRPSMYGCPKTVGERGPCGEYTQG